MVVVNHHLFCADLALRDEGIAELLPEVSAVIFDEAHQFAEIATQFFGESVSSRQIIEFARDCLRFGLASARAELLDRDCRRVFVQVDSVKNLEARRPATLATTSGSRMPRSISASLSGHWRGRATRKQCSTISNRVSSTMTC